jgi:tight adherence protein C
MQPIVIAALGLFVAGSVLALGRAARLSRRSSVVMATVSRYGYQASAGVGLPAAGRGQTAGALEQRAAAVARRLSPADYEARLTRRLLEAGLYTTRPSAFLTIRVAAALGMLALGLMRATNETNVALVPVELVVAPLLGWMLPDTLLSGRITRRRRQIERDAADMIDLLAITVQAGLGLDQAMKATCERLRGPLADEMRLTLGEIRIGQSRHEALRRLGERADTPAMRSFTRSMAQSEAMGVPISETLKALASEARTRKKATAEEAAQKAPIKMVFPLAVCIFPAILIAAAGPGLLATMRALGSS